MLRGQTKWFMVSATAMVAVGIVLGWVATHSNGSARLWQDRAFGGQRAYRHLQELCALGPRFSGSEGMLAQQRLLSDHFSDLGARVSMQSWKTRHPEDGSPVTMSNLIAEWHPERRERILICAHYDTRPFPDRDRRHPKGTFVGANDGASGVALLQELGRHMSQLPGEVGVDFVLFDGEEFIFDDKRDGELYFLGAQHFSSVYANQPPAHRYRCGVLLDMVGDAELNLYQERNSLRYARSLTTDIWRVAAELQIAEFKPRPRHEIRDDHLSLNEIARIPTCDIIDFDYPRPGLGPSYWHTEADTPDKCSAASLSKVGATLLEWLRREVRRRSS